MIDLRERGLPETIEVDGAPVRVLTDFRAWIEFDRCLREERAYSSCIFPGYSAPAGTSWTLPALRFLASPNETPRGVGKAGARGIDYVLDGEYIVAGFQQAYGIDLTDPALEMHWHRFKALAQALPDSTLMGRIVGYRTWEPSRRTEEQARRKARDMWALPEGGDPEALALQQRLFGGIGE